MDNPSSIIERYRKTQTGNGWHTAPDDGYLYDHLAGLLRDAGRVDELKALFADSNWMQVRVTQGNYDGFLADLNVAWELAYREAETQIAAENAPDAFLECLHYALIETSLRSRAEALTAEIVARAVETGLWSAERGLSLAALVPDEERRAKLYAALQRTDKLTTEQEAQAKTEALDAAEAIQHVMSRAMTLEMLSDQIEDQQPEVMTSALEAALQEADGQFASHGYSLQPLIPKLPDDLLERALSGVLALKNREAKAWALSALAKRMPEERRYGLLELGVEAALRMKEDLNTASELTLLTYLKGDVNIANALAQLADQLSGDLVTRALDGALALKEGNWRPRAIAGLMDKLDAEQVARVLENMLTIEDEWWRADGLMGVADHSTGEVRRRALAKLLAGKHGETVNKIQEWLNYSDTIELLEAALEEAKKLEEGEHRIRWQFTLETMLATKRKEAEYVSQSDLIAQAEAMLDEVEAASKRGENPTFLYAIQAIFKIEDEATRDGLRARMRAISEAMPRKENWASSDELERVLKEPYEEERSQGLRGIAKRLPEDLLGRALEAAFALEETLYHDWAFQGLAERLDGGLLKRALEPDFPSNDKFAREYALRTLTENLEEPLKSEAKAFALGSIFDIHQPYWTAERLIQMMPGLQGELATKAAARLYELAQQMTHDQMKMNALVAAIEHLTGEARQEALKTVLDNLWTYPDSSEMMSRIYKPDDPMIETSRLTDIWKRVQIVRLVLKHLEGEQKATTLTRALDMTLSLKGKTWFNAALLELAPHLEGDLLRQAFQAALEVTDERERVEAIGILIERLSPEDLARVLEVAATVENPGQRASLLMIVARRTEGEPRNSILSQAYEAALLEERQLARIRLLTELAQLGWAEAGIRGLELAQSINDERESEQTRADMVKSGVDENTIRYVEAMHSRDAVWNRTCMVADLLAFVPGQEALRKAVRHEMLERLSELRREKREAVLQFSISDSLWTALSLSKAQLAQLGAEVLHICRDWQWA